METADGSGPQGGSIRGMDGYWNGCASVDCGKSGKKFATIGVATTCPCDGSCPTTDATTRGGACGRHGRNTRARATVPTHTARHERSNVEHANRRKTKNFGTFIPREKPTEGSIREKRQRVARKSKINDLSKDLVSGSAFGSEDEALFGPHPERAMHLTEGGSRAKNLSPLTPDDQCGPGKLTSENRARIHRVSGRVQV